MQFQRLGGSLAGNVSAWQPAAWASAKQVLSLVVGFADGSVFGYRLDETGKALHGLRSVGSDLTVSNVDYQGLPASLVRVEPHVNATERPWYKGAVERSGFYLANAHSLVGTNQVGLVAAIPLFEDLQPPTFSRGREPLVSANGPIPPVRVVDAVMAVDIYLEELSQVLTTITVGSTNRSLITYVDTTGTLIAINNQSVALNTLVGNPVQVADVNNVLLNRTMAYLLGLSGGNYSAIPTFVNRVVSIDGEERILTCYPYENRDKTFFWYLVIAVPKSDFYGPAAYANMVALLVIFLLILPVLVALAAIFSFFCLSSPTRELSSLMRQIAQDYIFGKREARTSPIYEIRTMQESYDAMKVTLKSFSKFTNVHSVREMLRTKTEADLGVEQVDATMFFSDIEGFTTISESTAPADLIHALQEYFDAMTEVIQGASGTVGDFIGDAVFAFWNTPQHVGDMHACMAVEAALAQQERLRTLREDWAARGLPCFRVRMGINTGRVLAGNIGSHSRLKFTLIGDAVNLAARLEGAGKQYGTYLTISESTYRSPGVEAAFVVRPLDVVQVVGKREPTMIYAVLGRKRDATEEMLRVASAAERMMVEYRRGNVEEAARVLREELPQEDKATQRMLKACEDTIARGGPGANWTGVNALTEK